MCRLITFWGALLTFALCGCAAEYHAYRCGVPCSYCFPPPLPYVTYCGCATPIAAPYLQGEPSSARKDQSAPASVEAKSVSD